MGFDPNFPHEPHNPRQTAAADSNMLPGRHRIGFNLRIQPNAGQRMGFAWRDATSPYAFVFRKRK